MALIIPIPTPAQFAADRFVQVKAILAANPTYSLILQDGLTFASVGVQLMIHFTAALKLVVQKEVGT